MRTLCLGLCGSMVCQALFSAAQAQNQAPTYQYTGAYDRSGASGVGTINEQIDIDWKTLQPSPTKYDFSEFDKKARAAISKGKGVTFTVFTGSFITFAPDWIYDHGVPGVMVKWTKGSSHRNARWPWYLSPTYTKLFRNMHAALKKHLETAYTAEESHAFVGIEGVFGSTGDDTPWHGDPTDKQYDIARTPRWYEYWANESIALAHLYADWANDDTREFHLQLHSQVHHWDTFDMIKRLTPVLPSLRFTVNDHEVCKEYMEEAEKTSLSMEGEFYKASHTPMGKDGKYLKSFCAQDHQLPEGKVPVAVTLWQVVLYMLTWGQDRVMTDYYKDEQQVRMWHFFNRYAGGRPTQGPKIAGAWASLRDGLDSADCKRFPEKEFGSCKQSNSQRMQKIVAAYKHLGAGLDDPQKATLGTQAGRGRSGLNDCGWEIYPDNYHMFLEQLDASSTSVGMWRVGDFESGKPGQFFGRFARRFDHASGKDDMYFVVRGNVFASSKTVNMRVVYFDEGKGSWSLLYGKNCKQEYKTTKTNTGLWKEMTVQLQVKSLAQSCKSGADFALHNSDTEDDIFAFIELSAKTLTPLFPVPDSALVLV